MIRGIAGAHFDPNRTSMNGPASASIPIIIGKVAKAIVAVMFK